MTKARDLANLGNKTSLDEINDAYDAGALSNRNMIINGAMQVAQRGTSQTYSSNTSRGFVCDRWFAEAYPLNMTITQGTIAYEGITYKSSSLSSITGTWNFFQGIENGRTYNHNKTMTFSFVASGSGTIQPITWAGTTGTTNFGSSITLTSTPTRYEATHTLSANSTGSDLYIGISGSGGSMNISLTQLELGDTATPFEHRSYGDELAKCQRYYQKFHDPSSAISQIMLIGLSSTYTQFSWWPPVEMRVKPTVGVTDTSPYWESHPWYSVGTSLTITQVSNAHVSRYGGEIAVVGNWNPAPVRGTNYTITGEVFYWDAEL